MTTKISTDNIQAETLSSLSALKVSNVSVSNSTYYAIDDTAVNVGGGYIVVTGSGFQDGATVLISGTQASAVTFVDSTELHVQVPAKSAATYNLYVVNPDGATAIRVNGLTYSGVPTWVTTSPLGNQEVDVAFNISFDATGAVSYSNTSALPAGTTLLSNGYFYGTVTGIEEETTYNFTVRATDAENQDADKTFGVTVTLAPQYQLWSWGKNKRGQLGLNDLVYKSSPTQVGTDTNWFSASAGPEQTAVVKSDGTLWTWGQNYPGQLGLNDTIYRSSPTQVGSLTNWSKPCISSNFCSVIKTDGTLWMWGFNLRGELGLNDTINRSSPVQVGTDTNWSKICARADGPTFIKTDGTLWTWGSNSVGQLGLNDTIHRSSPIQIGTGTTWNNLPEKSFNGSAHMLVTKTDGTLWAWGYGSSGRLGLNDTIGISSPVQVGSDTTWDKVSIGSGTSFAIKTDGTLWAWGQNGEGGYQAGALGLNDTIYRSSPTQVGTDTNWYQISGGYDFGGAAIRTNGTLWTWGRPYEAALGLNDIYGTGSWKSSPTQVGTDTNWISVSSGFAYVMAIKEV